MHGNIACAKRGDNDYAELNYEANRRSAIEKRDVSIAEIVRQEISKTAERISKARKARAK